MNDLLLAIILATINGVSIVLNLSGIGVRNPLIFGVITGLLVGDVALGFEVGATSLLMNIGFYTYGGASVPDYVTGAMLGVVAAAKTGDLGVGLAMTTVLGLLMTQLDILGRSATVFFQHKGDDALANNDIKSFEKWHLAGTIPWFLARFIPVFIAVLFSDSLQYVADFAERFTWFSDGLAVVGKALPAVGFAMLLSYMDLKKYWPFMVMGYIAFAYMNIGTIGLAILGTALAGIVFYVRQKSEGSVA